MNLYFRFFYIILKNLLFVRPMNTCDTTSISFRVLPNDLDINMHMNNGRYLTIMDIGRTELTVRLGIHKLLIKERMSGVTAGVTISLLKPFTPNNFHPLSCASVVIGT